jgi:hypothetical protein
MFLISHASLPNDAIISPLEFGGRAAIFYFAARLLVCVLLRLGKHLASGLLLCTKAAPRER